MRRFFKMFLIANRFVLPSRYSPFMPHNSARGDGARSHKPLKNLPIRSLVALVAVALLLLPCVGCGGSVPPPTGLAIGAVLQQLTDDVNNIVENAAANFQSDILAAAGGVQDAIDEVASAYATELNQTTDQVSGQISSTINQLRDLVNMLKTNAAQTLQQATNDAQQLLNTIPFANLNPQVTSYTPHFIAAGGQSVEVVVQGNFFYAAQKKLTPMLTVNGTIIQPDLNTTNQLGFAVPTSLLPSSSNAIQEVTLELNAPYEQGLVFKSRELDSFRLLVSIMPANPVTSLILYTPQPGGIVKQTIIQPAGASENGGWHQDSFDCNDHTNSYSYGADPGWQINPSSAQAVFTQNKNPAAASAPINVGPGHVQITIITKARCTCVIVCVSNGSGDVTLYLTYTEEQPIPPTQTSTNLQIGWGDRISAPVTRGWTLKAKLFNGKEVDFNDTDTSNTFLQVVNHYPNITISAQFSDVTF